MLHAFEIDRNEPEDPSLLLSVGNRNVTSILADCRRNVPHANTGCMELARNLVIEDFRRIAEARYLEKDSQLDRDDIVIHLRCGDVLSQNPASTNYGFIPHSFYTSRIQHGTSQDNRTIGIVTQPFVSSKNGRPKDTNHGKGMMCKKIAYSLKQVLERSFPYSAVQIRNSDKELLDSMPRMVLAKEIVFCGPSSFCGMATLASKALEGYIYRSTQHTWLLQAQYLNPHIKIANGKILKPKGKSIDTIVHWMESN